MIMKRARKSRKKALDTPPPLTPAMEATLDALLEALAENDPHALVQRIPDPETAEALIGRLPAAHPAVPALLEPLYRAFPQKRIRKALRRLRFRLQQRGLSPPPLPVDEQSGVLAARAPEERPQAKLGPPDGTGARAVFIALPKVPRGFDVGFGVVSDEQGFIFFSAASLSKKQTREMEQTFSHKFAPVVDVTLEHAATVLEQAYACQAADRLEQKEGYLALRPRLQELVDSTRIDEPKEIPAADGPLTQSHLDTLFAHPLMKSWLLGQPIQTLMGELSDIQDSPLHLTDSQKRERSQDYKKRWIREHYTHVRLETLRARFEEMARFFNACGDGDHARLAARCALELAASHDTAQVNPVLIYLVERSLEMSWSEAEATSAPWHEDPDSGLILPR